MIPLRVAFAASIHNIETAIRLFPLLFASQCCLSISDLCPHANNGLSRTTRDSVLPLSEPIRGVDGKMMSEIAVPADTTIIVGIMACNRSRAIWGDDADEWKPERWLSPLPASVEKAHVPGVYANLCAPSISS